MNPPTGLLSVLYVHEDEDGDQWLLSTHPPVDDSVQRLLNRVDDPVHANRVGRLRP